MTHGSVMGLAKTHGSRGFGEDQSIVYTYGGCGCSEDPLFYYYYYFVFLLRVLLLFWGYCKFLVF